MSEQKLMEGAPLQAEALQQIRLKGAEQADLSSFEHNGQKYMLQVDTTVKLAVHVVTIEHLSGRANGHQQSMVALCLDRHDTPGVHGLGLMMDAFANGLVVRPSDDPISRTWRIVPLASVPPRYAKQTDSKT